MQHRARQHSIRKQFFPAKFSPSYPTQSQLPAGTNHNKTAIHYTTAVLNTQNKNGTALQDTSKHSIK